MFISAVICTRNRPDLIGKAVASVLANTCPDFDLIVVDQSDNDCTAEVLRPLREAHANLRYTHVDSVGKCRALNIGVKLSTGAVIAFTDDDCVVPPTWLQSIADVFAVTPDGDMLYGQVLVPPSLATRAQIVVPALAFSSARRISRRDGFQLYGMGANFAVRRELLQRIGGFDEVLGAGGPLWSGEDFDFEYRAYLAGATVLIQPEVVVEHYGVRDLNQWQTLMHTYGRGDGAFYFKHVRCGDLAALIMLVRRLATMAIREALNPIRRRESQWAYIRACLQGIVGSLGYKVDRRRRVYLEAGAPA